MNLYIEVKKALIQEDMQMGVLAEKAGMSRQTLHNVLTGNPTLDSIEKVVEALGYELRIVKK